MYLKVEHPTGTYYWMIFTENRFVSFKENKVMQGISLNLSNFL